MLSTKCAYCRTHAHFTPLQVNLLGGEAIEVAAECNHCGRFNIALGTSEGATYYSSEGTRAAREVTGVVERMEVEMWAPHARPNPDTEFIPEAVAGYYREAHHALAFGAFRAVLLLVRSVIEAAAKSKGVKSGTLVAKIDALRDEQLIRPGTAEIAHAIRILGNDMAHGDLDETPTREDAEDSLELARYVLDDIFVADARRRDILTRRRKSDA